MSYSPYSYSAPGYTPPPEVGPSRVGMALICLHIGAVLYLLIGAAFSAFMVMAPVEPGMEADAGVALGFGVCMFAFCAILAAAIEVVAYGIRKRKFWGWIGGLVIFALFAPSIFFPLGALGLWGLLAAGSRAEFPIGGAPKRLPGQPRHPSKPQSPHMHG